MRSARIAALIRTNTDRHLSGAIDRARWEAEQRRLWDLAMRSRCVNAVARELAPPLCRLVRTYEGPRGNAAQNER